MSAAAVAHTQPASAVGWGWLPTPSTALADAAVAYARHGWPVLPLVPGGKVPLTAHGLQDATNDVRAVADLWHRQPRANIGVRIPPGLLVIDVDGPLGAESLRGATGLRTLTARTGRGWHLWYRAPEGVQLRQGAAFLRGVDSRVPGKGYCVCGPSVHETGRVYEWVRRIDPAPLPEWLVNLLRVQPATAREPYAPVPLPVDSDRRSRYAMRALEGEAAAVASTPKGGRNHRLWAAWVRCRRDLADALDPELVRAELTRAALAAGLDESEVRRTLREVAP